jgi:hypothetical protein
LERVLLTTRFSRLLLLTLSLAVALQLQFLGQETSPMPEVGKIVDIRGAHETPNPNLDYKIVFDLNSTADKVDDVNPGL